MEIPENKKEVDFEERKDLNLKDLSLNVESQQENHKPAIEECVLVIIKPDAVRRRLMGKLIGLLEKKNLTAWNILYGRCPRNKLEELYDEHKEKEWFSANIDFLCSGPILVSAWYGKDCVKIVRTLLGKNYLDGMFNTIRGTYATSIRENCMHASDSIEAGKKECMIFFPEIKKEIL